MSTNKDVGVVEHIFTAEPGATVPAPTTASVADPTHDGRYSNGSRSTIVCRPTTTSTATAHHQIAHVSSSTTTSTTIRSHRPDDDDGGHLRPHRKHRRRHLDYPGKYAHSHRPRPRVQAVKLLPCRLRYWRTGTTPPADTTCASGEGTATCSAAEANDGQDGTYSVEFFSFVRTDVSIGATEDVTLNLDNTPPITTSSLSGTFVRGWYNTPVTVGLSAPDERGGRRSHRVSARRTRRLHVLARPSW